MAEGRFPEVSREAVVSGQWWHEASGVARADAASPDQCWQLVVGVAVSGVASCLWSSDYVIQAA